MPDALVDYADLREKAAEALTESMPDAGPALKAFVSACITDVPDMVAERALLAEAVQHYQRNGVTCPCGARPDHLDTHPHVGGCPVGKALERLGG